MNKELKWFMAVKHTPVYIKKHVFFKFKCVYLFIYFSNTLTLKKKKRTSFNLKYLKTIWVNFVVTSTCLFKFSELRILRQPNFFKLKQPVPFYSVLLKAHDLFKALRGSHKCDVISTSVSSICAPSLWWCPCGLFEQIVQ